MANQDDGSVHVNISWRAVAIAATVAALALLVALIFVVTTDGADILTTIALGLAILAFVSQLVIFAAQWILDQGAAHNAQRVYRETQDILSEIRSRTQGVQLSVSDLLEKVLDKVLIEAKDEVGTEEGRKEDSDVMGLVERLREEMREIVSEVSSENEIHPEGPRPKQSQVEAMFRGLHSWPSEAGLRRLANDGLSYLSGQAAEHLQQFATDLSYSLESGIPDGLYASPDDPGIRELVDVGVISPLGEPRPDGRVLFRMVGNKGRGAARLVVAPDPAPAAAVQLFPWLDVARATDENPWENQGERS